MKADVDSTSSSYDHSTGTLVSSSLSSTTTSSSTLQQRQPSDKPVAKSDAINFFERYLSIWVLVCMVIGAVIGYYSPVASADLALANFAGINGIVAGLLWVMILPMLLQIDFNALKAVRNAPAAIALTSAINYLVKPFTMYTLAILFFRVFYTHVIPEALLRDSYIAGLILLAGAPCTAMVFVWSSLTGGDPGYTLIQVAFNDVLMVALYVPTAVLLIGVSDIELPWLTIIYAVLLFIIAPLLLASTTRAIVISRYGEKFLNENIIAPIKPFTVIALLATLVLIFIFQGQKIADKPLHIVLIAIPITLQCILNWGICYYAGFKSCIPHERLAPASMIATSNFFELAVAVAISVYGLDSGAALATVVGVLVEVPVMLVLSHCCNSLRPLLDERCAQCTEVCDWANRSGAVLPLCCADREAAAASPATLIKDKNADISTDANAAGAAISTHDYASMASSEDVALSTPPPLAPSRIITITVWHNPECETSRNVLQLLEQAGYEPIVVNYLEVGWTRELLDFLLSNSGLTARQALRDTKSPAKEMGLLDTSIGDDVLFERMLECPVLVNRPFVVVEKKGDEGLKVLAVKLCRPSKSIEEVLETIEMCMRV